MIKAHGPQVTFEPEAAGALAAASPSAGTPGHGPVRVLVLGLVAALLIGCAGYVVSVALDPEPGFSQTMCVDSTCTYAMSAGMPMAGSESQHVAPAKKRSGPEQFVRDALSYLHIR